MRLPTRRLRPCRWVQIHPCVLRMAPGVAEIGRLDINEMGTSVVLWFLARSKSYLAQGYSTTCKPAMARVAAVTDAVHSNHVHADYKLEGEVLRRLRDVNGCSLEEFLVTTSDHVEKRRRLLEQAISQLT